MTRDKNFKLRVRERMRRTGETYTAARAALSLAAPPSDPAGRRAQQEQRLLVDRWFAPGRLREIPARRKVRAAVLLEVLTRFRPGRTYTEPEVNQILRTVHDDVAYLRRELVGMGYLERQDGRYTVCRTPPARTPRQRDELPAWETLWLPGFVTAEPDESVR